MQINLPHNPALTEEQHAHITGIIERFAYDAYEKYVAGQLEHGGNLWEKDVLKEARQETLDLVVYLDTEIMKRS